MRPWWISQVTAEKGSSIYCISIPQKLCLWISIGGCGEMYQLKERGIPEDMFSIMRKAYDRCSMMSCSLEPDPRITEAKTEVGLIRGHAYSITKVVKARIETPRVQGELRIFLRKLSDDQYKITGDFRSNSIGPNS